MYSQETYQKLKKKWGEYSSWAVWNENHRKDTSVIDNNVTYLNARVIFVGLNISKHLQNDPWSNFRVGKHDRKLIYACNKTCLRGSYLTDIFKGIPEVNSAAFKERVVNDLELIKKNVATFNMEMRDVGVTKDTTFVLFGDLTSWFFKNYFNDEYQSCKILNYYHYSSYKLTDKAWVEGLWELLDVNEIFVKKS